MVKRTIDTVTTGSTSLQFLGVCAVHLERPPYFRTVKRFTPTVSVYVDSSVFVVRAVPIPKPAFPQDAIADGTTVPRMGWSD